MIRKKKVMVFIDTEIAVRNFIATNAMESLEKNYEVSYITDSRQYERIEKFFHGKKLFVIECDSQTYPARELLIKLFRYKTYKYSSGYGYNYFKEKENNKKYPIYKLFRKNSKIRKLLRAVHRYTFFDVLKLLSRKGLYDILVNCIESNIPVDSKTLNIIDTVSPKVIIQIIASVSNNSIDFAKMAKQRGIPYGICPVGWDNISTKLHMYLPPYFVLERGKHNAKIANEIFSLPAARTKVIGVPHYDLFIESQKRMNVADVRKAFLDELGVCLTKEVILFAGSNRPYDEMSFLEFIDNAIDNGMIDNVHIIYRPHPDRNARIQEKSFFDVNFKNVTFDPELLSSYLYKKEYLPELNRYWKLYSSISFLICAPTSVAQEAPLFGKPVMLLACDDGIHSGYYSAQVMAKRAYFNHMEQYDWFIKCAHREDIVDDINELLKMSKIKNTENTIRRDIKEIVFTDDIPYSDRFLSAIQSI